jgi:hypothetical protein
MPLQPGKSQIEVSQVRPVTDDIGKMAKYAFSMLDLAKRMGLE